MEGIIAGRRFKTVFAAVLFVPLLICGVLQSREPHPQPAPDIIIDAGHGGIDGGAVGVSGVIEKDLNLEISQKLCQALQQRGFSVLMIRISDISLHNPQDDTVRKMKTGDLKNRLAIADKYPESVFVSIHQNSFPSNHSVRGATVYSGLLNPNSDELAKSVFSALKQLQPDNHRVIKTADSKLYLLSNAKNPAVLVECGFLTNQAEEQQLCDAEYQSKIAAAIADGICDYLNGGAFG